MIRQELLFFLFFVFVIFHTSNASIACEDPTNFGTCESYFRDSYRACESPVNTGGSAAKYQQCLCTSFKQYSYCVDIYCTAHPSRATINAQTSQMCAMPAVAPAAVAPAPAAVAAPQWQPQAAAAPVAAAQQAQPAAPAPITAPVAAPAAPSAVPQVAAAPALAAPAAQPQSSVNANVNANAVAPAPAIPPRAQTSPAAAALAIAPASNNVARAISTANSKDDGQGIISDAPALGNSSAIGNPNENTGPSAAVSKSPIAMGKGNATSAATAKAARGASAKEPVSKALVEGGNSTAETVSANSGANIVAAGGRVVPHVSRVVEESALSRPVGNNSAAPDLPSNGCDAQYGHRAGVLLSALMAAVVLM